MSAVHLSECAGGAIGSDGGHATARGAADWLYLAAAPTFAAMAAGKGQAQYRKVGGRRPRLLVVAAGMLRGPAFRLGPDASAAGDVGF